MQKFKPSKNDVKTQLDFLKQNHSKITDIDLYQIVHNNNLMIYFCHEVVINTLGVKETTHKLYVITDAKKNVICMGKKPDEIEYLYNYVKKYVSSPDKVNFRVIGHLITSYYLEVINHE